MRIFPPSLEIGDTEGFTPEKDIFGRATFGQGLIKVVQQIEDPLVILLNSPWGTGKTSFLKMWSGELRKLGHSVIYFDAFQHDYSNDPFISLAAEIISLSKSKDALNRSDVDKFVSAAAKVGKFTLKNLTKIGIKAATLGAIDAAHLSEELNEISSDIVDINSNIAESYVKKILFDHEEQKETIDAFKKALSNLSSSISAGKDNLPLIFVIDELDRCRPSFALDILEIIKHIFSVKNVHFVLSATMTHLESSVCARYGSGLDATLYLEKFYNFSISFPDPDAHLGMRAFYVRHISNVLNVKGIEDSHVALETVEYMSEALNLSFRTIERIMSNLVVSLTMSPSGYAKIAPIVAGLCVIKACDPNLFLKAKSGRLEFGDVMAFFNFDKWQSRRSNDSLFAKKWWMFFLLEDLPKIDGVDWDRMGDGLWRYNIGERTSFVRWTAQEIVEPFSFKR